MGEAGDLIVPVFLNQLECRLRLGSRAGKTILVNTLVYGLLLFRSDRGRLRTVPRGYTAQDRKLIVNEPEAVTVRTIFNEFLRFGSGQSPQAAWLFPPFTLGRELGIRNSLFEVAAARSRPDVASRRKVKTLPHHSATKGNCRNCHQRSADKTAHLGPSGERSPFPLRSGTAQICGEMPRYYRFASFKLLILNENGGEGEILQSRR